MYGSCIGILHPAWCDDVMMMMPQKDFMDLVFCSVTLSSDLHSINCAERLSSFFSIWFYYDRSAETLPLLTVLRPTAPRPYHKEILYIIKTQYGWSYTSNWQDPQSYGWVPKLGASSENWAGKSPKVEWRLGYTLPQQSSEWSQSPG
jgi:hypothetical protein